MVHSRKNNSNISSRYIFVNKRVNIFFSRNDCYWAQKLRFIFNFTKILLLFWWNNKYKYSSILFFVLFLWKCLLSISRKKVHILWNEKSTTYDTFLWYFFLKCLLYYYYILRFVLYDDGELTYSVDDHYDTIPQAVINLNNVFEITEADAITGNIIIHIGLKMLNFCAMHHVHTWVFLTRQK